jgi:hypothetical protein
VPCSFSAEVTDDLLRILATWLLASSDAFTVAGQRRISTGFSRMTQDYIFLKSSPVKSTAERNRRKPVSII